MKCRRSEELWSDYLEDALPAPLRKDLEEHLRSCAVCPPLLAWFREVVATLQTLPLPEPRPDLVERILAATPPRASRPAPQRGLAWPGPLLQRWAAWGAAAAVLAGLVFFPPRFLVPVSRRVSQIGGQVYSSAIRVYRESDRLLDELNLLRMTVGVAFEDRLDRLNERLKDLQEARQRNERKLDKRSGIAWPGLLSKGNGKEPFHVSRSLP